MFNLKSYNSDIHFKIIAMLFLLIIISCKKNNEVVTQEENNEFLIQEGIYSAEGRVMCSPIECDTVFNTTIELTKEDGNSLIMVDTQSMFSIQAPYTEEYAGLYESYELVYLTHTDNVSMEIIINTNTNFAQAEFRDGGGGWGIVRSYTWILD